MPQLTSLGGLEVAGTTKLTNLVGLQNVNYIGGGNLYIHDNSALVNHDGLQGLPANSSALRIENNSALKNLHGLNNMVSSEGALFHINGNASLANLARVWKN